jgi:hypothetical protein
MFDWINFHLIQHKTESKPDPESAARRGEFNN